MNIEKLRDLVKAKFDSEINLNNRNPRELWSIFVYSVDINHTPKIKNLGDLEQQYNNYKQLYTQQRNNTSEILPSVPKDISDILEWQSDRGIQCKVCKGTNIHYAMIANRSADEGMSADCLCRDCKCRFRIRV